MEGYGFLWGVLAAIAVLWVARTVGWLVWARRWRRGYHRHGPRGWLRGVFSRLDTTPGQEKAIVAAVEELRETTGKLRGDLKKSRADVAAALGAERFDADAVGKVFDRQPLDELRGAVVAALGKIHEALDPRQRKALAEIVESGFGYGYGWRHGC